MTIVTRPVLGAPAASRDRLDVAVSMFEATAAELETGNPGEPVDLSALLALIVPFTAWATQIPTAKGQVLDFARFPYQPELYEVFGDPTIEDVCGMKGVQVGLSELLTRLTLYIADQLGMTAVYVFPALKQMWEYSSTRVDPMREQSAYLQSRTLLAPRWPWSKGLKRIGTLRRSGFVHYRGSESKNELIAVDADILALDEYDSLAPQNVPEAERRIAGSLLGMIRRVGVPSDPEFGIAKKFQESDGREWLVKCDDCSAGWQPIIFHKNVRWDEDEGVIENPRVECWHCGGRLDVLRGEWVAERPGRSRPGFHIHRLMRASDRNLRDVIEASKKRSPRDVKSFWNNDLGLPHSDSLAGLDRAVLAAAISAAESALGRPLFIEKARGYSGTNLVTMGVDVASARALNVRISEHIDPLIQEGHRKRALWIGTVDSFNELPILMAAYRVTFAVIDHMPEMRLALGLAEQFPGRVYVCSYSSNQVEPLVLNTEDRKVKVLRTPAMDATTAVIRQLRNHLPEDPPEGWVEQMLAPRRQIEKDEFDRVTVRWESKGPDDYFMAEVYDLVATEVAKIRIELGDVVEGAGDIVAMDSHLEYERSRVDDYEEMDYRPGPASGMTYRPGPGDDE